MKYLEKIKTKSAFEIIFIASVGLSFILWMVFLFIGGKDSSQFTIFSKSCGDFIADSTNVTGYSANLDPYHNLVHGLEEKAYSPLIYVMMYSVSRVVDAEYYEVKFYDYVNMWTDPKFMVIFLIFTIINMLLIYTLMQAVKKGNFAVKSMTALALCCSFPMLFSLERGNTIIFTVCLCFIYLFNYKSENKIIREIALLALATAASFKITPALLGIMLLYNKQIKEAARSVVYGIIITIGPFIFLKGGFSNLPLMLQNTKLNLQAYSSLDGCTLAASLNRFGKLIIADFQVTDGMEASMRLVTLCASFLLLISVPFLKKNWEKTAAVLLVLIILPSHSGTYCVLYFIPAIIMFLNEEKHRNIDFIYLISMIMICWVFVCRPTDWFNYNLAIPVMVSTLIITGIINIISTIKNKNETGKGVEK